MVITVTLTGYTLVIHGESLSVFHLYHPLCHSPQGV